jgi:alpha-galactosidase
MPLPTKIVVIGAGSASFGENTLSALLRSPRLKGSTLALVDRNPTNLEIVRRLAERLNRDWQAQITITAHTHHQAALDGAEFVVSAIEVGPREELWKSDFEIPLKYGVRQPYAENGGPGGMAHAMRNIGPLMEIIRDIEQACPSAWFVNFTNPMTRICDAVNRYSNVRVVGLCHQVYIGYCFAGLMLGQHLGFDIPDGITGMHADIQQYPLHKQVINQALARLEIQAAGINHFTWILAMHDKQTGTDLYPLFKEKVAAYDPGFEPLSRAIFEVFGWFPVPGDTHLAEYLPWVSDPRTRPWERYHIRLYDWEIYASLRDFNLDQLRQMAASSMPVDYLLETDSEGALEVIESVAGAGGRCHLAANLPNVGQIDNLPRNAIVETPVYIDGAGVHPVQVGALPGPVAELCRRELVVGQLSVEAAIEGSYEKALQCLLLDPVITDLDVARKILDDYLNTYRQYLPQFYR